MNISMYVNSVFNKNPVQELNVFWICATGWFSDMQTWMEFSTDICIKGAIRSHSVESRGKKWTG